MSETFEDKYKDVIKTGEMSLRDIAMFTTGYFKGSNTPAHIKADDCRIFTSYFYTEIKTFLSFEDEGRLELLCKALDAFSEVQKDMEEAKVKLNDKIKEILDDGQAISN